VILHNDFHNPINRVVWRLWRIIPGMNMERATEVTWEAQTRAGRWRRRATRSSPKLYEDRLRANGLTVSTEPAS
jgi:hypothetical protein